MMAFTTECLTVRTFTENDDTNLAVLNSDPRVMEYFPTPLSRSQSLLMLTRICEHQATHGFSLNAIETRADGVFIGFVGLVHTDFDAHFTPAIEVGWRLHHAYWGRGFATEAACACIEMARAECGVGEVVSFTAEQNLRSRAVMARLRMTRDSSGDFNHPNLPIDSFVSRHVLYRLAVRTQML